MGSRARGLDMVGRSKSLFFRFPIGTLIAVVGRMAAIGPQKHPLGPHWRWFMSVSKWSIVLPVLLLTVNACHKRPPATASTRPPAPVTTPAPPSSPRSNTAAAPPEATPLSESQLFRSEEHMSELQSLRHLVCRLLLEKK